METTFPVTMDPNDRANRNDLCASQMVVQQYARYPSTLESALQSASSLGSARSQSDAYKSPALHRRDTPRSLQSSPKGPCSAIPASAARTGPSMSPPLFETIRQQQMKDTTDQVESRELPSREVTDDTIVDAYVLFILYCNPNVPASVDTSELRRAFRCPPRSDGKSFNIYTLFGLIRKLQNKELKTWIQLAIELGVEPPSMEKKQSTQKVQQYAVRLKRWMHAMHIDAFFEYCMGNSHDYYTQLPPPGPFVGEIRDGVALEEDLALRALVPQWKPKRGRKRAEERELDETKATKRPQLDTSVGALHQNGFQAHPVVFPQSAIPFSAYPDADGHDPWMTSSSAFPATTASKQPGHESRWRHPGRDTSPANYPQSAIVSRENRPADAIISAEPRSAVTPVSSEKTRSRRRHGPAVSSAWPTSNGSTSGKARGRPPNRPTSGSFSTFLMSTGRDSPQTQPNSATQGPTPTAAQNPSNSVSSPYNQSPTPANTGRPSKLQLQVPPHVGAPVRLATPPTLLVNGVNDATLGHTGESQESNREDSISAIQPGVAGADPRISVDDLVRTLSGELLKARLTGRPNPLSSEEVQAVASAMVVKLSTIYSQLPHGLPPSIMAFQIGVGHHFGLPTPNGVVINIHVDPHVSDTGTGRGAGYAGRPSVTQYTITIEYKAGCHFSVQITLEDYNPSTRGAETAEQKIQDVEIPQGCGVIHDATDLDLDGDDLDGHVSEATWKQRYLKLRSHMQKKDRALLQYKRKIVDSVMADI